MRRHRRPPRVRRESIHANRRRRPQSHRPCDRVRSGALTAIIGSLHRGGSVTTTEMAGTVRERAAPLVFTFGRGKLFHGDCIDWLHSQPANSIHGVVTDPPYGLVEYTPKEQAKLRRGRGGVW